MWEDVDHEEKVALVKKYIEAARANAGQGIPTLNFAGFAGYPGANAQKMNEWLKKIGS